MADEVYDTLLGQLMSLRIVPGSRVTIDALARDLGVSQTPIRDALNRMEAEGLVVRVPHAGYRIPPQITRQRFEDMVEIRLLLEPAAARRAAERASSEQVDGLRRMLEEMAELVGADGLVAYGAFGLRDAAFHDLVAVSAENEVIREALARLHTHVHLFRLLYDTQVTYSAMGEHDDVLRAIAARDPDAAAYAMRQHILRSGERFRRLFAGRRRGTAWRQGLTCDPGHGMLPKIGSDRIRPNRSRLPTRCEEKQVPRALLLTGDAAEELDTMYPYYRVQEGGWDVDVASRTMRPVQLVIHEFDPDSDAYVEKNGRKLPVDVPWADVDVQRYDALIIPGGRAPEWIRVDADVRRITEHFFARDLPIALVCHGAQVPAVYGLLKGRKTACFPPITGDMENAGATVIDAPDVVDGNLVSCRGWPDMPQFGRAMMELFSSSVSAAAV